MGSLINEFPCIFPVNQGTRGDEFADDCVHSHGTLNPAEIHALHARLSRRRRNVSTAFPHGSHITRKPGVYHYRRRLPGITDGGVCCLSPHTRGFREAEHRAAILDIAFNEALTRARGDVTDAMDLNTVLRGSPVMLFAALLLFMLEV
jgi:hypothetical protein